MAITAKLLSGLFSNADQTCWLMLIVICLGACLIAALWELEQLRIRWRERNTDRAKRRTAAREQENRTSSKPHVR